MVTFIKEVAYWDYMPNELSDLVLPKTDEVIEKVVQLYINGNPLLICGNPTLYHGQILEQILKERGMEYETFDAGTEGCPFLLPKPSGPRYEVVGMGTCQKLGRGSYLFAGHSENYSTPQKVMAINEEHLRKIKKLHPDKMKSVMAFIDLILD